MTDAEILQTLKLITQQRATISMVALAADVSRQTIYQAIHVGHISPPLRERLIKALGVVQKRGFYIPRVVV